jgi:hypothetical protein
MSCAVEPDTDCFVEQVFRSMKELNMPFPEWLLRKHRRLYSQAMTGRHPLAAIRAKCLECMSGHEAEVRRCLIRACPLFPNRMGQMQPLAGSRQDSSPDHPGKNEGMEAE